MPKADKAWVVLAVIAEAYEEIAYIVGANSAADAKKRLQEQYDGDPLDMFAAELDANAVGVLQVEADDLRMWGLGGQSPK